MADPGGSVIWQDQPRFSQTKAEENSGTIGHRSHDLVKELHSTVKTDEIEAVEHSIAVAVQENRLFKSKRSAEFITEGKNSAPRAVARELSRGTRAKVAS